MPLKAKIKLSLLYLAIIFYVLIDASTTDLQSTLAVGLPIFSLGLPPLLYFFSSNWKTLDKFISTPNISLVLKLFFSIKKTDHK
jgi:hypothetical protein